MRLWSFQPVELVDSIVNDGKTFHCDESLSYYLNEDNTMFKEAYDWLVKEMVQRVSDPPSGVKYPVWAWFNNYNEHKKPDLRTNLFNGADCREALMELEIPDDRVVLSDIAQWNFVLNRWAIISEEEEARFNGDDDAIYDYCCRLEDDREALEATWLHIFDRADTHYLQATFWEVRPEDVVKVHPIHRKNNGLDG